MKTPYCVTLENVTKGEINHELILVLSQCFQKSFAAAASKDIDLYEGKGWFGKW